MPEIMMRPKAIASWSHLVDWARSPRKRLRGSWRPTAWCRAPMLARRAGPTCATNF